MEAAYIIAALIFLTILLYMLNNMNNGDKDK